MAEDDTAFDQELYSLLNRVLDNYLGNDRSPEIEESAIGLMERGYFFCDPAGNLRLSDSGKAVLREGARRREPD